MFLSKGIVGTAFLLTGLAVAQESPKADLFFGYSFLRVNSAQTIPAFTMNGGIATLGINFNPHIAFEAELGGYHNGNINNHQFDTTTFSYLFGPRISRHRGKGVDPYIHFLFGGSYATTSICCIPDGFPNAGTRWSANQNGFAMALGGGLDLKLSRLILLRPIQLDYYMTNYTTPNVYQPQTPPVSRNQNDLRYAAGIAFNFGGERPGPPPPPPPPSAPKMKACPNGTSVPVDQECPKQDIHVTIQAHPAQICSGELSSVAAQGQLPEHAATQWAVNGERISEGPGFQFGGTGRNPGSYTIGLRVAAEGYNDASTETTVRVDEYQPPTGTLNVSPSEIFVGEKADVSANFRPGQCGGPLGPVSFSADEGSFSGNQYDSTGVHFDPPGPSEQRKSIALTAKVSDGKGTGSATTSVVVKQKAGVMAKRLPDILFPAKSDRVNNCGKRVLLEALRTLFESDPGGTVVFVGHEEENETGSTGLDTKRALNAAAVISAGQGICARFPAAQIQVKGTGAEDNGVDFQPNFCAASAEPERSGQSVDANDSQAKYRRVEVWFVPSGGTLPLSAKDAKDAASLGVGQLGCPR